MTTQSTSGAGVEVQTLPLAEEQIQISKREITENLRVRVVTDAVEERFAEDLRVENVEIERVPIERLLALGEIPPDIKTVGDVTIIPVFEEHLVVERRVFLKEEIHIRQATAYEKSELPVIVRKQRVVLERLNENGVYIPQTQPLDGD